MCIVFAVCTAGAAPHPGACCASRLGERDTRYATRHGAALPISTASVPLSSFIFSYPLPTCLCTQTPNFLFYISEALATPSLSQAQAPSRSSLSPLADAQTPPSTG